MRNSEAQTSDIEDRWGQTARWIVVGLEIAVFYGMLFTAVQYNIERHNYIRFLLIIPLLHAGSWMGITGGILATMTIVFLYIPLIPIETYQPGAVFKQSTQIIMVALYIVFGVLMGLVGEARKTRRYVSRLSDVYMEILGEKDEPGVMRRACREAMQLLNARGAAGMLKEEGGEGRWTLTAAGRDEEEAKEQEGGGSTLIEWVASNGVEFITNSAASDPRVRLTKEAEWIQTAAAVPVACEGTIYGAILVVNKKDGENFTKKDIRMAGAIADMAGGAIHDIAHEREKQKEKRKEESMRELFSRFVSGAVAEYVLENPGALEARKQTVTALVSDLRNFTSMSESMPARELVSQLNEYFTAMVDVIFEHKGAIDKFIGDCIIAYWGAPAPDDEHAANAVRAARAMSAELDRLNAGWVAKGKPAFETGIAIHTCEALMGYVGDERKKAFTILGEEVDRAIRMESLTKELGVKTLVSERAARESGNLDEFEALEHRKNDNERYYTMKKAAQ